MLNASFTRGHHQLPRTAATSKEKEILVGRKRDPLLDFFPAAGEGKAGTEKKKRADTGPKRELSDGEKKRFTEGKRQSHCSSQTLSTRKKEGKRVPKSQAPVVGGGWLGRANRHRPGPERLHVWAVHHVRSNYCHKKNPMGTKPGGNLWRLVFPY